MPVIMLNIFAGIIFTLITLISIINIVNPKWVWEKFESHDALKEPSKEFFIMRRVFGIFGLLIVSFFLLLPHLH